MSPLDDVSTVPDEVSGVAEEEELPTLADECDPTTDVDDPAAEDEVPAGDVDGTGVDEEVVASESDVPLVEVELEAPASTDPSSVPCFGAGQPATTQDRTPDSRTLHDIPR